MFECACTQLQLHLGNLFLSTLASNVAVNFCELFG